MKNWTVRSHIILAFSAVVAIMVLLSLFSLMHLRTISSGTESLLQDSLPGFEILAEIRSLSQQQYALLQKHMTAPGAGRQEQLASQVEAIDRQATEAFTKYEATVSAAEEHRLFNDMKAERTRFYADSLKVPQAGSMPVQGTLVQEFDDAFSAYMDGITTLTSFNQASGDKSAHDIYVAEQSTMSGMIVALALALVLSLGCAIALIRAIDRPITRVMGGMQEQLAAANEVAATTAEVGATSKEISATAKELMQTVKGVTAVAEETAAVAASGQTSLTRMKNTMQQIVEASASINSKLAILSEKAGSIGTVITTITKVADQTNLLSLNAAIEAEKAGEYGRGFSVVATEIRRLADQSALATTDIEQMVQDIQSAVSAGVMGMDKFSEEVRRGVDMVQHVSDELSHIILQVQNLTASFETVSDGMQSQAAGAQQISEALMQLTEASRQTVESLRQSNLAIEQLNTASRTMQHGVARFTLAG